MEILIDGEEGMPDGSIVSIRFGATRRQAPLETVRTHPLKFPSSLEACCEPLKIDVLQPVASARLVLHPHEACYRIGLDTKDSPGQNLMALGLKVQGAGKNAGPAAAIDGQPDRGDTGQSPSKNYHDAAASARDYLETHGLLRYVQSLLHAVIQVRPKDPYAYMMQQLSAPRSPGAIRPTTPGPGAQAASNAGPMYDILGSGLGHFGTPSPAEAFSPAPSPAKVPESAARSPAPPPFARETAAAPRVATQPAAVAPALPAAQNAPQNGQLDEIRLRMRDMLETAVDSGTLNCVMESVLRDSDSPQKKPDVQLMKDRLREMLERTCDTGELQSAMEQVLQQTQNIIPCDNKDLDDAKLKMRSLLEDSVENGRLESLLSKQLQKDVQPKSELEDVRVKMREMLETAIDSGQLHTALSASQPASPQQSKDEIGDIRAQMRDMLSTAVDSGALQEVLSKTLAGSQTSIENSAQAPQRRVARDGGAYTYAEFLEFFGQEWGSTYWNDAPPDVSTIKAIGDNDSPVSVECIRGNMRDLLLNACESGTLQEAFASMGGLGSQPQPDEGASEVEAMRQKMRNLLESAVDSGSLQNAFVSMGAGQALSEGVSEVEQMRQKMRNLLEGACDSGTLQKAFASIGNAPAEKANNGAASENDADVKLQIRKLLESAVDSGTLHHALSEAMSPKDSNGDDIENMRLQMRSILEGACDSGQLQTALDRAISQKAQKETADVETMRVQMRKMLESANDSGTLQSALEVAASNGGAKQADRSEEMRSTMRSLLETSMENGKLEEAFAKVGKDNVSTKKTDVEEMRDRMRMMLETASETGALRSALSEARGAPEQTGSAGENDGSAHLCKLRLRQLFEEAYDSGELATALRTAFKPEKSPEEATVSDLKSRMREMLEVSCESGALTKALGSIQKAREETSPKAADDSQQLSELRSNMRDILETAAESGALCTALGSLSQVQKAKEVADMRDRMRDLLVGACDSGQLHTALTRVAAEASNNKPATEEAALVPRPPVPPATSKPTGPQRPKSAAATIKAEAEPKNGVADGSARQLEGLSQDMCHMKEDNKNLHSVVDLLTQQLEDLKRENQNLADKVQRKRPGSAS